MKKPWEDNAWNEYLEWQTKDKKTFKNFGRKFSVTCLRDESPFSLSNL